MKTTTVSNQQLFYFNRPDNTEYVGRMDGTLGLEPIILLPISHPRWMFKGQRDYAIVDGHNRAYIDATRNRQSFANVLETDGDLLVARAGFCDGHIAVREDLRTLFSLEEALWRDVEQTLALGGKPWWAPTIFNYGGIVTPH